MEVIRILLWNIHRKRPKVSKAVKQTYEVEIIKIKPENIHHKNDPPIPKLFLHKNVPQNTRFIWIISHRGHIHRGSRINSTVS